MNINRHNYEEYFMLYIDRELNSEEIAALELFVQENPDLREELKMLEQAVFRPEKKIVFTDKASLLKSTVVANPVNESNCEEFFILYGDDELTNIEKDNVEQFVYKNPQFQASFELLQQARVTADQSIVFPDKQTLYRSEKDEKVLVIRWWRIAAAAAILLLIGGTALYLGGFLGKGRVNKNDFAQQPAKNNVSPKAERIDGGNNGTKKLVEPTDVAQAPQQVLNPGIETKSSQEKKKMIVPDDKIKIISPSQNQQPVQELVAENTKKDPSESNLTTPKNVIPTGSDIVKVNVPGVNTTNAAFDSVDPDKDFEKMNVNDPSAEQAVYASNNNRIEVLNTSVNNKGKMRSFFRKVGRVVDKATHIGNTAEKESDKKAVRIANFEIALK